MDILMQIFPSFLFCFITNLLQAEISYFFKRDN